MPVSYVSARSDVQGVRLQGRGLAAGREALFWKIAAVLVFFPITAILHHRIFSRPHCMTNLLHSRKVFVEWIGSDPSPWLGLAAAVAAFILVSRNARFRSWVAAFPIAFLPLSVWIWDIPGTSIICPLFHDGKIGLRSWHLYLLGTALYLPIVSLLMRTGAISDGRATIPSNGARVPKRPVGAFFPSPVGGEIRSEQNRPQP